jgi:hypothetical protein
MWEMGLAQGRRGRLTAGLFVKILLEESFLTIVQEGGGEETNSGMAQKWPD